MSEIKKPEVRKMKVADIKLADWNPRKISDEERERLKRSLVELGNIRPIVWNSRSETLIGGHQRVEILKDLGIKEWDVFVVDVPLTTEKGANIALNQDYGEFDILKLGDIFRDLMAAIT